MDKEKIKVNPSKATKNVNINIKVTKDVSAWLKENKFSPTGIFTEAIKDFGYK